MQEALCAEMRSRCFCASQRPSRPVVEPPHGSKTSCSQALLDAVNPQVAVISVADDNQQTAAKYGIMAIPSMLIFQIGEERDRVVGFKPKDQLVAQFEGLLS